jgi:hypothetical protein
MAGGQVAAGFALGQAVDEQSQADDADQRGHAPVGVQEHRRDRRCAAMTRMTEEGEIG